MTHSYKKKHSKTQKNLSKVQSRKKLVKIIISAAIIAAAFIILFLYKNKTMQTYSPISESIYTETLKDLNGLELTTDEIMQRFNSFMSERENPFPIKEISFDRTKYEKNDVYVSQNKNIQLAMFTPKGRKAVSAVSIISDTKNPSGFINYSLGFMSVFTPAMSPEIRQKVLLDMMGCTESGDISLIDENTYIIGETKYTFTHAEINKFGMLIEQMPKLELYSGDISDLFKR